MRFIQFPGNTSLWMFEYDVRLNNIADLVNSLFHFLAMKASTCALSKVKPLGLGLLGSFFILHSILSHISPPVLLDRTCTLLQVAISDSDLYLPVKLAYYNI